MFPRQLSEKVFSFQDGQPSLAFSIWMQLGETGSLIDCGVTCSRVTATRMTYAELNQRLTEASAADTDMLYLSKVNTRVMLKRPIPPTLTIYLKVNTPGIARTSTCKSNNRSSASSLVSMTRLGPWGMASKVTLLLVLQEKKYLLEQISRASGAELYKIAADEHCILAGSRIEAGMA